MSEFRTMFTSFGKTIEIDPAAPFFDSDTGTLKILHKISVWKQENIETAITDEIIKTAKEHEVNDLIVLDKKAILDALQKQIPKKVVPFKRTAHDFCNGYCETTGRSCEFLKHYNHEYQYTDYNCPSCGKRVSDGNPNNCCHCGQALEW